MQPFKAIRISVAALAALASLPAFADIAAFNAAVTKADYKAAAAEAAATWPTLDKSRDDIAIIAREFGFAAYVAGDHGAAKSFAEFAAGRETEADAQGATGSPSVVLLRLSEHRLAPDAETRSRLAEAVTARAALPGVDVIAYLGADALVAFDFEEGDWRDAQKSAELGVQLTASGAGFALQNRRFELLKAIAEYRDTQKPAVYRQFRDLTRAVAAEIEAAPNEEVARRYVPLYWEITAWREAVDSHLVSRGRRGETREDRKQAEEEERSRDPNGNLARVIHKPHDQDACEREFVDRTKPEYPKSAYFDGYVGSVVLQADIDESGKLGDPQILAAVPDKYFGEAVLEAVDGMRYRTGRKWDPARCTLAEKGHVIRFKFQLAR